ncbi:MAG: class I SAM-dependent methyltransferase [Phycisphaerales bacterium]|nr:class I SAM-dependent methyltransferase [Phycisphaerales bacterium]
MSSDDQAKDEFDLNIIYNYFLDTERQGPGSTEATRKALNFIAGLSEKSLIADLGCGTGGQTIVLAQNTTSKIIGVELWPVFIKQFNKNIQTQNFQDRVQGIVGNMDNLPFEKEELDLIWSEGAIYNIGFERGLNDWRKFLKQDGYIAVTEISWLGETRPTVINDFWQKSYSEINTIPIKITQMQKAGYLPIANFILPENCWSNYYAQQARMQESFLQKYAGNKFVEEFVAQQRYEATLFDQYKAYYGYVFYIGKRIK